MGSIYRIPKANQANYKPGQVITGTDKNNYYVTQNWALRNKANKKLWTGTEMPDYTAPTTGPSNPTTVPTPTTAQSVFRTLQDFMPKDWTEDPLFSQSYKTGQNMLNKQLSAKGLLGSGAEDELNNQLRSGLLSEQTQRFYDQGIQNYNAFNTQQANEANRLERQGNETWDRIMEVINTYLGQNPINQATQGTSSAASIAKGLGDALAQVAVAAGTPSAVNYPNQQPNYGGTLSSSAYDNSLLNLFGGILSYLPGILGGTK